MKLKPIPFELEHDPDAGDAGAWIASNDEFSIFGIGRTKEEAIADAETCLRELVEDFMATPDNEFHKSAIPMKRKLEALVISEQDHHPPD